MVGGMQKQVVCKRADVEIERDEVVDVDYLASGYLLNKDITTLQALYCLAPYFCWQGKLLWSRQVP